MEKSIDLHQFGRAFATANNAVNVRWNGNWIRKLTTPCSATQRVNNRDKNFTGATIARRLVEESEAYYLSQLDAADRRGPSEALAAKTAHLKKKFACGRPGLRQDGA